VSLPKRGNPSAVETDVKYARDGSFEPVEQALFIDIVEGNLTRLARCATAVPTPTTTATPRLKRQVAAEIRCLAGEA
jgi:hypothetical protein